jgi:ectoine hydroxylase-related dioxygenase (phytanoyl-CoA dioxygenase family)
MIITVDHLYPSEEICSIGISHLKRYWQKCQLIKKGELAGDKHLAEWTTDVNMLAALGLGIEQTLKYIYTTSESFEAFEEWILIANNQQLSQLKIDDFNRSILSTYSLLKEESIEEILTPTDIDFWNTNGYIIIKNAITQQACDDTIDAICQCINIDKNDATTWYNEHPQKQGIMIQLFQHSTIEKNRQSPKIKSAYQQLWQRNDIFVNMDKVGFNPPEKVNWKFPASKLHWDVSLKTPIPFGTQGILYLTDTSSTQGAFTVVPRFHNTIEQWLKDLPVGAHPREQNLYPLGPVSIAANAGDFIIWHHALPHAASPNTSTLPRFVQYLNYAPLNATIHDEWI